MVLFFVFQTTSSEVKNWNYNFKINNKFRFEEIKKVCRLVKESPVNSRL